MKTFKNPEQIMYDIKNLHFPWWRRLMWRALGQRVIGFDYGSDDSCVMVIAYKFRGELFIATVEGTI